MKPFASLYVAIDPYIIFFDPKMYSIIVLNCRNNKHFIDRSDDDCSVLDVVTIIKTTDVFIRRFQFDSYDFYQMN